MERCLTVSFRPCTSFVDAELASKFGESICHILTEPGRRVLFALRNSCHNLVTLALFSPSAIENIKTLDFAGMSSRVAGETVNLFINGL
jgi:hypothetical protein